MTPNEFTIAMAVLEAGKGKSLTDEQLEVWHDCLKDLPLAALQTAIKRYLCEGDDWPSIAKIRNLAGSAMHGEALSPGAAFGRASDALRRIGFVDGDGGIDCVAEAKEKLDAMTWEAIEGLGGWPAFCESPERERATLRAQFRMAYEGVAAQTAKLKALPESVRPQIGKSPAPALVAESLKLPEGDS